MPPKRVNAKAAAAAEKQAALQAERDHKAAADAERAEAAAWKVGSNTRKASRDADSAAREDEKRRREAEKAKLMAEEEAETSGIKTTKKKGKKKGDDVSALLQAGLKNAPKSKFEKQQAAKKKEKEARRKKQAEEEAAASSRPKPEDDLMPPLQENLNHLSMEEGAATGIDAALGVLASGGGGGGADPHPEKRRKALYKAFEERQLPIMREEHPGLKLSQYKERIFDLWKKSPENPANQPIAAPGGSP